MAATAVEPKATAPPAVLQAVPLAGAMEIPLGQVVPSKTNRRTVRNADADLQMVESIRMRGVQQAIVVRPLTSTVSDIVDFEDRLKKLGMARNAAFGPGETIYEIVCGHRRWELSLKAGKTTVPAIVRKLSNAEALEIQNIENLQREDLDPIDRAEAIHDLYVQYLKAMTPKDAIAKISSRLNCKERTLYNMMSLRNLLPEVVKAIRTDEISMSHGYVLATLSAEPQKQTWAWLKDAMEYDPVSVRDLQDFIRDEIFRRLSSATWILDDANLLPAAGACTKCPKNTAVNPSLAPDEKKPTCTDPPCFDKKEKARLVQIEAMLKVEEKEGSILVAGEHGKVPKNVVPRDGWRESKEGSCPDTIVAFIATGPDLGQKRHVCLKKTCSKHWKATDDDHTAAMRRSSDSFSRSLSPEEKKARLQKTRNKKLDEAYRTAATAAITHNVTELKMDDLRDLAFELLERTDRRMRPPICAAMGWKVAKNSYYGPAISRKQVEELKPAALASLIALTVLADNVLPGLDYYGHSSKIELAPFAKRHKIDLAKIKDQAEAPLKAKFKAIDERKKAQASTSSTKSTKAKAKKAGKRKAA